MKIKNEITRHTAIIIPCFNESERLQSDQLINFLENNRAVTFIFVNDGSSDCTLDVLKSLQAQKPLQIEVIDLPKNGGKAEAVRQGMISASQCEFSYIGYWDADLATPLEAIEDFSMVAERRPEIQVIYGARRRLLGRKINRKFTRRIISRICATLARVATGLPINDTQAGAKLFANTPVLQAALDKPFSAGWLFDVELFIRVAKQMSRPEQGFFEYPLLEWNEIPGSKVDTAAVIKSGMIMLGLIVEARLGFQALTVR